MERADFFKIVQIKEAMYIKKKCAMEQFSKEGTDMDIHRDLLLLTFSVSTITNSKTEFEKKKSYSSTYTETWWWTGFLISFADINLEGVSYSLV